MLKRLFLFLSALAVIGTAGAQDFFHRPSPLAGRTMLTLSVFDEVKVELKVTPDQATKLEDLITKLGAELQDVIGSSGGDMQAIMAGVKKLNIKYDLEAIKLLKPEQAKRLQELFIQFNGTSSVTVESIAKELGVTDDQKAKLKKLEDEQTQKMMDALQGGGGSPEEMAPTMKRIQEEYNAGILKILTDDQRAKLKAMEGVKFEFKKA